jgi:4-hydroxy-2-oxoheptanedioate aldolase
MVAQAMLSLKHRLIAGETLLGGIMRMPAEQLVELGAISGLDYIVIDCEHGPADLIALQHHVALADAHQMPVLARVGYGDPGLVLRTLDLGVTGIIVPHVDTAADAEAAVAAVHYPPLGRRGFATSTRAGRFGAVSAAEHLTATTESTLLVVMIETDAGCRNVASILAVDGIDAVLVGPADLAVSLGLSGGAGEPEVQRRLRDVESQTVDAGRHLMTIVSNADAAVSAPRGLIVYNLTHVLLQSFRELVAINSRGRGSAAT